MNWKDISIFKKIGLGSGLLIFFLIVISTQSFLGISGILKDADEVVYGNSLDSVMAQKELDHLNWASRVSKLLNGEDPAGLDINTDHRTCSFGKWYYSGARKKAEAMVPQLGPLLKQIEGPHREMHASGQAIKEAFKPDHGDLDLTLSGHLSAHTTWVANLGKAIAEEAGGLFVYQSLIRNAVQQAVSRIREIDGQQGLSLDRKKSLAYESLKSLRYGDRGEGYFFILDTAVNMVMNAASPDTEGKNQQFSVDRQGTMFFRDLVTAAVDQGQGFVTYYWNLPDSGEIAPKLTYALLYKPWNWVVATGIYVDHTNQQLMNRVEGFALGEAFETGLVLDPEACEFAAFLKSPETRELMEAFPAFQAAMVKVQASHTRLHQEGTAIEEAINALDMQNTVKIFQNRAQEDLKEFSDILTTAIDAEKALKQTRTEAETIYTTVTLPALADIQALLERLRKTARTAIKTDDAIRSTAQSVRIRVAVFSLAAVLLGIGLTYLIARSISTPLLKSVEFVKTLAGGDLTGEIHINRKDEIGVLCDAMNQMSGNLNTMFLDVNRSVHTLTASATELSAISEQISGNSHQTAGKSASVSQASGQMDDNMTSVAAAAEEAAASIRMVAAAAEEMAATITGISENTARGSRTTTLAVDNATAVSGKVDELGRAAAEISKVTDTIADISEQTNLLALNATIEAARAGAAGKGFAVVASEIKDLAHQTAAATGEINSRIANVQATTRESIQVIDEIVKIIGDVDGIVTSVAAAMEEQSSGTREISDNISQAAQGLEEVSENVSQTSVIAGEVSRDIQEVSRATEEMDTGSGQIRHSAGELSRLAEGLNEMVGKFKTRA